MPIFFANELADKIATKVLYQTGDSAVDGVRNAIIGGTGINGPLAAENISHPETGVPAQSMPGEVPAEAPTTPHVPSTLDETIVASFKLYNSVFNLERKAIDFMTEKDEVFDPNFRALENHGERIKGYEEYAMDFINAKSPDQVEKIKMQIDYLKEQNEIIANASGWHQVLGWVEAATIDPLMFVPAIGQITKIARGEKILQGARQGAAFAMAGTGVQQGIEVASQQTKSKQQAMEFTLFAGAFGAAFGGLLGGISKGGMEAARSVFMEAARGEQPRYVIKTTDTPDGPSIQSVSAAKTNTGDGESLARINENLVKVISPIEALRAPSLRGLLSPFETMKKFTNRVFDHNYILNKEVEGIARGPIAELDIKAGEKVVQDSQKYLLNSYVEYTGVGAIRSSTKLTRPEGKLSFNEFKERVAKLVRDESIKEDIPQVVKVAKQYRQELDAMLKKLQAAKILGEDIDPNISRNYLTRMFNQEALQTPSVKAKVYEKVKQYVKNYDVENKPRTSPINDEEASELAGDILDKWGRQSDEQMTMTSLGEQLISKGKFTKQRVVKINDNELSDVLVNDIDQLFTSYMRKANAMIEMDKAMKDLGAESLPDLKKQLKAEKDNMLVGLSDKEGIKLNKKFDSDMELLDDMYRSQLGQLRKTTKYDKYFGTLLDYNYLRMLGGVTLSSIGELAMAPFRIGLTRTLRDSYLPMIRSLETAKFARDELADLHVMMDMDSNTILKSFALADVDLNTSLSKFDQARNMVTSGFSTASGISWWTSMGRRNAGQAAAADIFRTLIKNPKGLSGSKIREFANIGIGTREVDILQKELKHVEEVHGSFIGNFEKWSSDEARDIMRRAVQKQVDSIILLPGKGDLPIVVQKYAIAKVLFQFKSFMSAATGRVTISGLQRRDANVVIGLTALVALNSLSYIVKAKAANQEVDYSPSNLIMEGISRAGFLGLIGTAAFDTIRRGYQYPMMAGKQAASQVLGPSYSLIEDATNTVTKIGDGEVSNTDARAAARLFPFNNLFYINAIMQRAFPKEDK